MSTLDGLVDEPARLAILNALSACRGCDFVHLQSLTARTKEPLESLQYYSGVVKPRELAHDAQLYRLFETERKQLEDAGGRVTRVLLDYQLKREYHTYVSEQRKAGVDPGEARSACARDHDLPFARAHIELPDLRIEYEDREGVPHNRDLELETEHYSRSQLSGKPTRRLSRVSGRWSARCRGRPKGRYAE